MGEYEDYIWGYHRYPLDIFTRVENQSLKQRLKQKRTLFFNVFSYSLYKDDMKINQLFRRFPFLRLCIIY